jgi:hypothetical protein
MGRQGKIGPIAKGTLHRELHIPQNQPVPLERLQSAMRGAHARHDVHEEEQIQFAENARHFHHDGNHQNHRGPN